MLVGGKCGWSEIPADKFTKDAFYHPHPQKKGCFNATGGYFLRKDHANFDAAFFSTTEQEARAMGTSEIEILLIASKSLTGNTRPPAASTLGMRV